MKNSGQLEHSIDADIPPCDYLARLKAASENPVATSIEFINMMQNILSYLIG
jgi:hypothetical protein